MNSRDPDVPDMRLIRDETPSGQEPATLHISVRWRTLGRLAFLVVSGVPVIVAYTLAFRGWPSASIGALSQVTCWCALLCWLVAGGKVLS